MQSTICVILFALIASDLFADLKTFVEQADDSYSYEVVKDESSGRTRSRVVHMTSQTWEGQPWKHWICLITPSTIQHPEKAILIIVGGSNQDDIPKLPKEMRIIASAVEQLGVPVAIVSQIPNQPLFGGLKEDDIIAQTMTHFFESNRPEDLLLLPMVKSAIRAMDCVVELMDEDEVPISEFIVSGASKRGWTTYLSAAVDKRVIAAAPIVIDMLNIPEQMTLQQIAYGKELSPQVEPYTSRGVLNNLNSKQGKALLNFVDPYSYRKFLTMPKLLLLGTNDPYWTVNAANVYYDQLPRPTYLHYVPNAGHNLNLSALPTLLAFFKESLRGKALNNFSWQQNPDGSTAIIQDDGAGLTLWQAHSPTMDFRTATWSSSPISEIPPLTVNPKKPENGFLAYYIQANYPGPIGMLPYSLCTQITVLDSTKK